MTACE